MQANSTHPITPDCAPGSEQHAALIRCLNRTQAGHDFHLLRRQRMIYSMAGADESQSHCWTSAVRQDLLATTMQRMPETSNSPLIGT